MAKHLALIDRELVAASLGPRRLIVQMPPRHGKSELIGRYFPAWFVGAFPDRRVMYASYESDQARTYGRFARNVLQEWGPGCFGVHVARDAYAADYWNVEKREGGMIAAGVGGPLTGKGANMLIVDDPIKNAEQANSEAARDKVWQWWESTALTRLEPGASVIIVQTRWHCDDLAGRSQREMPGENWRVLSLPALAEENDPLNRPPGAALWPDRYNADYLTRLRDNRSLYWWKALYQQQPTRHESLEWPAGHFEGDLWFDDWPADPGLRVITLDPSKGKTRHSDFSAYVLAAYVQGAYFIEADLKRRPPGRIVEDGVEHCRRFKPWGLGVESNTWQDLLGVIFQPHLEDLNHHYGVELHEIYNHVNKTQRIRRLDPYLRNRRIRFRNTPGTRLLVQQLKEFPLAAHDDGPDALEMALRWIGDLLTNDG